MSKLEACHPREKLWPIARAHGFEPDTKPGRALLARFAGIEPRKLESFASSTQGVDYNVVVALSEALNAPLIDLLAPQRRDFSLLPIYPFTGGEPLFVSMPRVYCMGASDESLFYLQVMHDSDFRSGNVPGTWFVGQRRAPLEVGQAYVLSGDAGEEIRRCTDVSGEQVVMSALDERRSSIKPMELRLDPDMPGFLIQTQRGKRLEWLLAGRILGTFTPA